MSRIERICLTGDVFRTSQGERNQLQNVEWLRRRFGPLLAALTGIHPEIRFCGREPFGGPETIVAWYGMLGERPTLDAWARTFWMEPPAALVDVLAREYEGGLVVSIEMSPLLQRALNEADIPWVDVTVSPIRYLSDFAISFQTSRHFGTIANDLLLSDEEITAAAAHVRHAYRMCTAPELDGALVFFAQTETDRTLIKDGGFAGVIEAIEGIHACRDGRRLFVKPHPWNPEGSVVAELVDRLGAQITRVPTYAILSSAIDLQVVTLSSSVGPEARTFAKPVHVLHEAVQRWAHGGPSASRFARSPQLWGALLGAIMDVRSVVVEPWRPNVLRSEIGHFDFDLSIWSDHAAEGRSRSVDGFYERSEAQRIALTEETRTQRRTLVERWTALTSSEAAPWGNRAAIAAEMIGDVDAVVDLGCGTMALERCLVPGTFYYPVDVSARDGRTLVVDLNVDPPPQLPAPAVVCLGLLEYLHDPGTFMQALAGSYETCAISYCNTDAEAPLTPRRAHAWVNDFSTAEIEDVFTRAGWLIVSTRVVDTAQRMWLLRSGGTSAGSSAEAGN